jgi:hypothetical protein
MATKRTTKKEIAETAVAPVKKERPLRGRGGTDNFHNRITGAKSEDISRCIKNCMTFYGLPIVKDDEECRQRLEWFFDTCGQTGQLPTVEKMVMSLGAVKSTVFNWENGVGCSQVRMNLIKKAKEFIASFESEMVTEGKINPVVYIFRAKNYFGMKDQQDVVLKPESPLGSTVDQARLESTIVQELDSPSDYEV